MERRDSGRLAAGAQRPLVHGLLVVTTAEPAPGAGRRAGFRASAAAGDTRTTRRRRGKEGGPTGSSPGPRVRPSLALQHRAGCAPATPHAQPWWAG